MNDSEQKLSPANFLESLHPFADQDHRLRRASFPVRFHSECLRFKFSIHHCLALLPLLKSCAVHITHSSINFSHTTPLAFGNFACSAHERESAVFFSGAKRGPDFLSAMCAYISPAFYLQGNKLNICYRHSRIAAIVHPST